MYMSRLAAMKEFAFMKALRENGFPVPEPIAQNRHTIVMSLIEAFPLRQISDIPEPAALYSELINMILRLARFGLIHGDFNEFNILVKEEEGASTSDSPEGEEGKGKEASVTPIKPVPILIDFPQMVSVDHPNAEMYFDRDVNCIKRFFQRRFHFTSDEPGPSFTAARKQIGRKGAKRLDVEVEASGFSKKMARELEAYMKEVGVDGDSKVNGEPGSDDSEEYDDDDDEEEEEEEEDEEANEAEGEGDGHELEDGTTHDPKIPNDDDIKTPATTELEDKTSKGDIGVEDLHITKSQAPPGWKRL